ncbi:calymmin [Lampris incognitus]|uniref:calymmin n=1 Tax=Lampris incognitus TaxID=2546036 RepID=UPI0024B51278|nr:calymmin [Lampris incognitus]
MDRQLVYQMDTEPSPTVMEPKQVLPMVMALMQARPMDKEPKEMVLEPKQVPPMDKEPKEMVMELMLAHPLDKGAKEMAMDLRLGDPQEMEDKPTVMSQCLQMEGVFWCPQTTDTCGECAGGFGGAGNKPMKGFGRPLYGAGAALGMGAPRTPGVPQLAGNQRKGFGSNGFGYGPQPMGGYGNYGAYPRPGLGMKGPKPGHGAPNGQGTKPNGHGASAGYGAKTNGYGGIPNGYGVRPNGFGYPNGGAKGPKPGYGAGIFPKRYGAKPNGYGAGVAGPASGYGGKPNGYGGLNQGSKLQSKGLGAISPSGGAKAPNGGHGVMLNGQGTRGAGSSNGKSLKGGVLSPEQGGPPQLTQGVTPSAPEPTHSVPLVETQGEYGQPPAAGPPSKSYKPAAPVPELPNPMPVAPQPTPGPGPALLGPQGESPKTEPVFPKGKYPKPAPGLSPVVPQGTYTMPEPESVALVPQPAAEPEPGAPQPNLNQVTPEFAPAVPQGRSPNPAPETGPVLPQGKYLKPEYQWASYVTGSAVPELQSAEADLPIGVDTASQGDLAPERGALNSSEPLDAIGTEVPETEEAKDMGVIVPEETGTEAEPELVPGGAGTVPDSLEMPTQGPEDGRRESNAAVAHSGQATPHTKPGYGAEMGAAGSKPKGFGAGAEVPNGHGANANGFGAGPGGYGVPGYNNGYRNTAGYGQGVYLGAGSPYRGTSSKGYGAATLPEHAGSSQFEPQPAGFSPNVKPGSMYGGMGGLPYGGQHFGMAPEKSPTKYGIGGLQFGGQPVSLGPFGAGKYTPGGAPYGPGGEPAGKYGYGGQPYGGQPLALGPDARAAGNYGYGGSPYEAQPMGLGSQISSAGTYGGAEVPYLPDGHGLGGQMKSAGKYVVVFPEAPTLPPSLALPSYVPVVPSLPPEEAPAAGTEAPPTGRSLASVPASQTQAPPLLPEQHDSLLPQQPPQQIHIQQHLKLHFHPEAETGKGNNPSTWADPV